MAHAVTNDTRTHSLGDLHMVTGTFTDGGTEINMANRLSTVIACGAFGTSVQATGVKINNGSGEPVGQTALTVDAAAAGVNDCRYALQIGQTIYNAAGSWVGIVSALGATTVTIEAASVAAYADDEEIYVMGSQHMDLGILVEGTPNTSKYDTSLATASYDAANNLLIVTAGSKGTGKSTNNASSVPTMDGRWWALGKR